MKSVVCLLPRQTALKLSLVQDKKEKTARDVADYGLKRDWLDQVGLYPEELYPLQTPPRVVILYSTKGRLSEEPGNAEKTDAETEKDCVLSYFAERNFYCTIKKNPTAKEVFSSITACCADDSLSGLIVFVMSHGEKGMVSVEGSPNVMMVQDIITHMCINTDGKPKVNRFINELTLSKGSNNTSSYHAL